MLKVLLVRLSICVGCSVAAAGCTVSSTDRPGFTGPSTLAVDVQVTATPDSVVLDGVSSSTIAIRVRGADGAGIPNAEFRLSIEQSGSLGTITPSTVYTDATGRAAAQFMPRKASPALAGAPPTRITIVATPVRSNYQGATHPNADMLLLYPAVPAVAAGTPAVSVGYAPSPAKVGSLVTFDASASQASSGSLVSYVWDFGDSTPNDEHGSDASHTYSVSGTYYMTLAVTDDSGRTGYAFRSVTVSN